MRLIVKTVITYGTYDLLHEGHLRLLKRAKALGDYLIVGVTSDDYDKTRGKINNKQSLIERMAAVKATGLADKIIVEEYEGQKIDDIKRFGVDIFTVGSDWKGKFDYLQQYCQVIYLPRTEGISSSQLRAEENNLLIGIVGQTSFWWKFVNECHFVNGIHFGGIYTQKENFTALQKQAFDKNIDIPFLTDDLESFLNKVDAVYIISKPAQHYNEIRMALLAHKHVLCESPISESVQQTKELVELAKQQGCILMEAIKTAYATAYERVLLVAQSGRIGRIISIDATCTSLNTRWRNGDFELSSQWNSIEAWGPTVMLPVFQLLGSDYNQRSIVSQYVDKNKQYDGYTKINFIYPHATATVQVAKAAKSEGELVITGEKGYIYVPAPWWKTAYFEVRYENPQDNLRYFYQLDGEGIRYEVVAFVRSIETKKNGTYIDEKVSLGISKIIEECKEHKDVIEI